MKAEDMMMLKRIDEEYEKRVSDLADNYKGDWDDEIHDSYSRFIIEVEELSHRFHTIRCKMERMVVEVEELDIEDMKKRTDSLCMEADSL